MVTEADGDRSRLGSMSLPVPDVDKRRRVRY
jgi:hypothetical protein